TVLHAEVQLHVSHPSPEIGKRGIVVVGSRPQGTGAPASHAVGSSTEVTFLKGQDGGIAVWIGNTDSGMGSDRALVINAVGRSEINIPLDVLGIGNFEELVEATAVLLTSP